jgi:hypothetical protein
MSPIVLFISQWRCEIITTNLLLLTSILVTEEVYTHKVLLLIYSIQYRNEGASSSVSDVDLYVITKSIDSVVNIQ